MGGAGGSNDVAIYDGEWCAQFGNVFNLVQAEQESVELPRSFVPQEQMYDIDCWAGSWGGEGKFRWGLSQRSAGRILAESWVAAENAPGGSTWGGW